LQRDFLQPLPTNAISWYELPFATKLGLLQRFLVVAQGLEVCSGDTKVQSANVVDHVDSYDELVSRLACMNIALENEIAKTSKLKNETLF
jgi:hypothetical protein